MTTRLIVALLIALTTMACSKEDDTPPVVTPPTPPPATPAEMTSTKQNEVKYTFKSVTQGTSYTWDFGDGQTAKGKKVEHTFPKGGSYSVKLTVIDAEGTEYTAKETVSIDIDNTFILSHQWQIVEGTKNGEAFPDANGAAYTFYGNGEGLAGESIEMPWEFNSDESAIILWPGLSYETTWNLDALTMWGMEINFTSSEGDAMTYKFEQL